MHNLHYLYRCIYLARQGGNRVFPNPQVGAVIVYQNRIIGEGFHPYAGGPHAEVVAIASVKDKQLLKSGRMYVSLEPCNHFGKTPPCTELILRYQIPHIIVGCQDPNPKVAGTGIKRLREAGVRVDLAADPLPFEALNTVFFVNQREKRPFVVLKWAQSADGFIAGADDSGQPHPTRITGPAASTFVHRLRAQHHAIMVGRRTAEVDDPSLTTRLFYGNHPLRLVFDRQLKLPDRLQLFHDGLPTIVLNEKKSVAEGKLRFVQTAHWNDLASLMRQVYGELNICSILVEGGTHLLQQFIDQQVYDEVYCFQAPHKLDRGVPAPELPDNFWENNMQMLGADQLFYRSRKS